MQLHALDAMEMICLATKKIVNEGFREKSKAPHLLGKNLTD